MGFSQIPPVNTFSYKTWFCMKRYVKVEQIQGCQVRGGVIFCARKNGTIFTVLIAIRTANSLNSYLYEKIGIQGKTINFPCTLIVRVYIGVVQRAESDLHVRLPPRRHFRPSGFCFLFFSIVFLPKPEIRPPDVRAAELDRETIANRFGVPNYPQSEAIPAAFTKKSWCCSGITLISRKSLEIKEKGPGNPWKQGYL